MDTNSVLNIVFAAILTLAPQFMPDLSASKLKDMYAAAQLRADYILQTGDTSDLEELNDMMKKMGIVTDQLDDTAALLKSFGLTPADASQEQKG